jgi:hypothetical protein
VFHADEEGAGLELIVVDVSDPANPRAIGNMSDVGGRDAVRVLDGVAYLPEESRGHAGIRTLDVGDPSAPMSLGELATRRPPGGISQTNIEIVDDRVYVAAYARGVRVYDVSEPALPRELGGLPADSFAQLVKVKDDLLYVLGETDLQIFDLGPEYAPTRACWARNCRSNPNRRRRR